MATVVNLIGTILPFDFLSFPFMRYAFLAIVLLTPLLGLMGTMAVNQRMAFFSDALGHSALTGIGIGVLFNIDQMFAMIIFDKPYKTIRQSLC